ncbi:MAG: hypothetical protein Q8K45_07465 [Rubrivivax sp.]|nr:hypothetical protein [Rubrivivax sp.]
MRWAASAVWAAVLFHGMVFAQNPLQNKSVGPVVLLPPTANVASEDPPPAGSLNLPGREYRAGHAWWALACDGPCTLLPLRLAVTARLFAPSDEAPVAGQTLRFAPTTPPGTLLLFKPVRAPASTLPWRAGTVATGHSGAPSRLRATTGTPGTQEAELPWPDGRVLRLVPVRHTLSRKAAEEHDGDLMLELALDGRRQTLGRFEVGACEPLPLRPATYLQWAGDMDHDGRPDLLVNFSLGYTQHLALFLSSLAEPGQIVGEAGRFRYEPIDVEGC